MTASEYTRDYPAVTIRQHSFRIGVRLDPSEYDVESFAAILFLPREDGSQVEVAKIDDSPHEQGDIHIDRFYRSEDAELKDFDIDVDDCWEAEQHLCEHAQQYARRHLENHGPQPRSDG